MKRLIALIIMTMMISKIYASDCYKCCWCNSEGNLQCITCGDYGVCGTCYELDAGAYGGPASCACEGSHGTSHTYGEYESYCDAEGNLIDDDNDGVPNTIDRDYDSDGDGVRNGLDECANTETGAAVDTEGCSCDQNGYDVEICGYAGCCKPLPDADEIGQAVEYYVAGHIPTANETGQAIVDEMEITDYEEIIGEYREDDEQEAENAETDLGNIDMPDSNDMKTEIETSEIPDTGGMETAWMTWLKENNPIFAAISGTGIDIDGAICEFNFQLPNGEDVIFTCCNFADEMEAFGTLFLSISILSSIIFIQI